MVAWVFQSTRPIRGATALFLESPPNRSISIHAPHTGRDQPGGQLFGHILTISIHAPHTGRDTVTDADSDTVTVFQSTRPIRGATTSSCVAPTAKTDFNPRAPYGARRVIEWFRYQRHHISIHAPHTGRDCLAANGCLCETNFNPRAPYGARRCCRWGSSPGCVYFNPRAPYGARRVAVIGGPGHLLISIHAPHTGRDSAGLPGR